MLPGGVCTPQSPPEKNEQPRSVPFIGRKGPLCSCESNWSWLHTFFWWWIWHPTRLRGTIGTTSLRWFQWYPSWAGKAWPSLCFLGIKKITKKKIAVNWKKKPVFMAIAVDWLKNCHDFKASQKKNHITTLHHNQSSKQPSITRKPLHQTITNHLLSSFPPSHLSKNPSRAFQTVPWRSSNSQIQHRLVSVRFWPTIL